jgi:hypothetical protein
MDGARGESAMRNLVTVSIGLFLFSPVNLSAADWGDVAMRFVYAGEPPTPQPPAAQSIGQGQPAGSVLDESLIVDKFDRGVKNVCVWLLPTTNGTTLPIHASYDKSSRDRITMTISAGEFAPRIALVRTTQSLVLRNDDAYGYSIKLDGARNEPFNELLPPSSAIEINFHAAETAPAILTASIQPSLIGYVLPSENPYAALSDDRGRLTIRNVPAGQRTFVIWHERGGYIRRAVHDGRSVEWPRGRLTLEIERGRNDLGDVKLSPDQFSRHEK